MQPAFANAKNFAVISGRSVAEVRQLCKAQIIPNEKSGRDYRIDVETSIAVLKSRAENYAGHKLVCISVEPRPSKPKKRNSTSFDDKLKKLARGYVREPISTPN